MPILLMPQEILARALQQAAQSEPPVRAAALLHIARVLAVFDRGGAVRVLDDGLAVATALSGLDRDCILGEAVVLSAAVDPEHALRLVESEASTRFRDHVPERLVQALLDCGTAGERRARSLKSAGRPVTPEQRTGKNAYSTRWRYTAFYHAADCFFQRSV
ncbi:MAG: hypothetical protein JWO48_2169 [Bryobacterales bacterium]|nr:hypothetical protein [Bryobacterales bacterium]